MPLRNFKWNFKEFWVGEREFLAAALIGVMVLIWIEERLKCAPLQK